MVSIKQVSFECRALAWLAFRVPYGSEFNTDSNDVGQHPGVRND
jgi:hypothetical protein